MTSSRLDRDQRPGEEEAGLGIVEGNLERVLELDERGLFSHFARYARADATYAAGLQRSKGPSLCGARHSLAPDSAATNDTHGWLLVQRGETARGLEFMRQAVELAPADADKPLHLARRLAKVGDKEGARKELAETNKAGRATSARNETETMLKEL